MTREQAIRFCERCFYHNSMINKDPNNKTYHENMREYDRGMAMEKLKAIKDNKEIAKEAFSLCFICSEDLDYNEPRIANLLKTKI